jgi:hypothetical protein
MLYNGENHNKKHRQYNSPEPKFVTGLIKRRTSCGRTHGSAEPIEQHDEQQDTIIDIAMADQAVVSLAWFS